MSLSRLAVFRHPARRLHRQTPQSLSRAEVARGLRSMMLPLMRNGAGGGARRKPTIRYYASCRQPTVPCVSATTSMSVSLTRNVTSRARQTDSFTVSDAPYSQQLRHLQSIDGWMDFCEAHGSVFQGVDNFAAIRKLVELLRSSPTGMPPQVRERISNIADGIFQATTNQVSELESSQQQVLVLELSQLGVVFISPDWHACCPPVPVPLLNGLLDSLLQRLRTLRGGQVGVLLISLQRLQLCDSDAYSFILQEIERQLKVTTGDNSWYRQPDHLAKLVRGVVTVFLGIPRSMPRAQARNVLTLLIEAVADLPDEMWGPDEWKGMASIVESLAEVPRSLEVPCGRMHSELARRIVAQQPGLSGKVLSQLMAAYTAGPFADHNAVAALLTSISGRFDQQGTYTMADIAESLSRAGDKWGHEVRSMASWALEAQDITNESGLRMLAAGARVGVITDTQWGDYCSRFAAGSMGPSKVFYTSSADRELQLLLEAALHYGSNSDLVSALCDQVAAWMNAEKMRLWRIVPYMVVVSKAHQQSDGADSYTSSIGSVFEAATRALVKEIHPQMIMSQRGQLLMSAISASISAGRKDAVDVILSIDGISSYLQDQGEPVTHVLAEAICKADVGSGSAAPAGSVWEAILQYDKPLSQMSSLALSRLANALWTCQPHEAYIDSVSEAALEKLTDPTAATHALAHELQPVKAVVEHVQELIQPKVLNYKAKKFLEAYKTLHASMQGSRDSLEHEGQGVHGVGGDADMTRERLASMKMTDLKSLLVSKGLLSGGNKSDMIERLLNPDASVANKGDWDAVPSNMQVQSMTNAELREILASKGLKVSGNKRDLIDRLLAADQAGQVGPARLNESRSDVKRTSAVEPQLIADSEVPARHADGSKQQQALSDLTVAELKNLLRNSGLKLSGKKSDLIERCMANGLG
eukprot:jgi/Ulvmu1/5145/UM021_0162.1